MKIDIPIFDKKYDKYDFLMENKSLHISEKKSATKYADAIHATIHDSTNKAATIDVSAIDKIEVDSVINTTRVMDSHDDVHIDGLWNKSLRINKDLLLLQEHIMKFDHVISDQVKGSAVMKTWKELGFPKFKGETQALMFKSIIEKSRNGFMFDQYGRGFVKNHSVGMRYIKLFLAINNDSNDYKEEFDTYNKYIDIIVNRKEVEAQGFFWAVTEARAIEGSAVVKGSNPLTPTTSIEAKETEQSDDTQKSEQSSDTQKRSRKLLLIT